MRKPFRVEVVECRGSAWECGAQLAGAFLATPRGRAFRRRKPRQPFAFSLAAATAALERHAPNLEKEVRPLFHGGLS